MTEYDAIIHEMTRSPEDAYQELAPQPLLMKKQVLEKVAREMVNL
jgi:hypothetical protein